MSGMTERRTRVPLVMAVGGTLIAAASIPSRGVVGALLVEAVTVAATLGYYHLGGRDTDAGALVGSRPDERQHGIALRASAQAAHAMVLAALAGFVFETASGGDPWPFAFLIAVGGASFVAGLACSHGA